MWSQAFGIKYFESSTSLNKKHCLNAVMLVTFTLSPPLPVNRVGLCRSMDAMVQMCLFDVHLDKALKQHAF